MSYPALYITTKVAELAKSDILTGAKKIMQDKGMADIKTTSDLVTGHTTTVRAAVVAVKKHNPPSPPPGLGTSTPPTYIIFFTAAGSDAKAVLEDLSARWNDLHWL
jgi:hypothetical protein